MTDNLSRVALRKSKIIYLSQPLYLLQRVRIFVEPLKFVVNGASLKLVRHSLHVGGRGERGRKVTCLHVVSRQARPTRLIFCFPLVSDGLM